MCGIAGWIDHSQDMSERIDLLNKMSETLDRRGPDENGLYINQGAALMHRRLVVIDRENGKQPMSVRHKDTTYVIVYNGELYNTAELREELFQEGYVKRSKFKGKPPKALPPIRYRSSDGYEIRVGRNNKQNDRLTCKEAEKTDLWLHVKDITGSHVIVTCDGEMPPDRTIEEAAIIAACNSKGRNSSRVDVDYTFIRNVKKPNGSKPGMVIFTNNYTITVKPDTELEEKLRV